MNDNLTNLSLVITYISLLSLLILNIPVGANASGDVYDPKIGYRWKVSFPGVSGKIKTIDKFIISGFYAEWVNIDVNPYARWWVQTGFIEIRHHIFWHLYFYVEKHDFNGEQLIIFYDGPRPEKNHYYIYQIVRLSSSDTSKTYYEFTIWDGSEILIDITLSFKPYHLGGYDLKVAAEPLYGGQSLDNSHFCSLRYFDGRSWPLWYNHQPVNNDPDHYILKEISHHEFKIYGKEV